MEQYVPRLLLGRDIDAFRTKAGIERAVLDILRTHGVIPQAPVRRPRLKLVKRSSDSEEGPTES